MGKTGTILDYMGEAQAVVGDGTVEPFKPGRPSEHEHGVVYYAPWETLGDGFSEHSRRTALALQKAGKNVHLRSYGARMFIARTDEELVAFHQEAKEDLARYAAGETDLEPETVVEPPEVWE